LMQRKFSDSGGTVITAGMTFTARNELASISRTSPSVAGSAAYTYDPAGRLTHLQQLGRFNTNISNYTYVYDAANRLTSEQLNGTTTTYQYDATNELTSDGTNSYSYDLNGNRTMTGYQTGSANELTNDGVWTYTYDNEGNLTKKSKGPNAETWFYGYDNVNHMISAKQEQTDGGTLLMQATY